METGAKNQYNLLLKLSNRSCNCFEEEMVFHSSGLLFHATESHIEIRVADSPDVGFVFVCCECVWLGNKETTWAFHRQNGRNSKQR